MRCLEIDIFIYHATRHVYVNFPLFLWFAMISRFMGTHDEFRNDLS